MIESSVIHNWRIRSAIKKFPVIYLNQWEWHGKKKKFIFLWLTSTVFSESQYQIGTLK